MNRRYFSLALLGMIGFSMIGSLYAATFPFPAAIDPTSNTVQPGKIYKSGDVTYFAEKKDNTIQLFEVRDDDASLMMNSRQTAMYNAENGSIITASDSAGATVPTTEYAAIPSTGGGIGYDDASIASSSVDIPTTVATAAETGADPNNGAGNGVTVIVTEKIPGADCVEVEGSGSWVTERKYRCTVKGGFATVQAMLGGLIKYATFITALLGVLMIVFSGFQYATSAWDTKQQTAAVQRISKLVGGLVLLFLMALILNTIAPWIYG